MNADRFRERSDTELGALSDDELIAYIRAAHSAGRPAAGKRALAILVYGHWRRIRGRVLLKVSPREADDVVAAVVESALGTAFRGESVGEFWSFVNRITARRIADHHDALRRRPGTERLPTEHAGDDDVWGDEPGVDSEAGAVETRMLFDAALDGLSDTHRRVVELYCLDGREAAEIAAEIPGMTEANVHQIASRFRSGMRRALGDG